MLSVLRPMYVASRPPGFVLEVLLAACTSAVRRIIITVKVKLAPSLLSVICSAVAEHALDAAPTPTIAGRTAILTAPPPSSLSQHRHNCIRLRELISSHTIGTVCTSKRHTNPVSPSKLAA